MRPALLALLCVACGPQDETGPRPDRSGQPEEDESGGGDSEPEDSAPAETSIAILTPTAGGGVYATAPLTWEVTGFTLDAAAVGGAPREGYGHVHAWLDGALVGDTADAPLPVPMASGAHALEVRLAGNDHVELPYGDAVEAQALNPTITLTPPWNADALPGSSAVLGVAVTEFTLAAGDGERRFGVGHYALSIDGTRTTDGVDPGVAMVTRIPEGVHTVQAELVHDDGSPLAPAVFSNPLEVGVDAGAPYVALDVPADAYGVLDSATLELGIVTANHTLGGPDGKYHVYVDGAYALEASTPTFALFHLSPGLHQVEVRLVDRYGEMPSRDILAVRVAEGRPDVVLTYPRNNWGMDQAFTMTWTIENFGLEPAFPGPNAEGRGHVRVLVDGAPFAESGTASAEIVGLARGERLVRVELVQNDGAPLEPPVFEDITLDISSGR